MFEKKPSDLEQSCQMYTDFDNCLLITRMGLSPDAIRHSKETEMFRMF
jgi:hypothetical protein